MMDGGLWGESKINRQSTDFWGSETILYDNTMVDICHYTFVKTQVCIPPRNLL